MKNMQIDELEVFIRDCKIILYLIHRKSKLLFERWGGKRERFQRFEGGNQMYLRYTKEKIFHNQIGITNSINKKA